MSGPFDLLRIVHQTVYRYHQTVTFSPHRLVLRPREGHDLRVESLALATIPRSEIVWSRDVFGNSVAHAHFTEPGVELRIESDVTVRRTVPPVSAAVASIAIPYPLEYEELERPAVAVYLQPIFPQEAGTLREWLHQRSLGSGGTAEEMVLHLTEEIHRLVKYRRRDEKGVQSPAATVTLGQGSCRDVACLLMESARHLGIATRFASGYLDCAATRAAQGVTHAWTEVYFPGLGWRGYDATTGKRGTPQHIVTGVSNHPRGVMPISGRFSGNAADYRDLTVHVEFSTPKAAEVGLSTRGAEAVPPATAASPPAVSAG